MALSPALSPGPRRAVIVAGGRLMPGPRVQEALQKADLIIAVDGGTAHCLKLNVQPDLVLGDLDSLSDAHLAEARQRGWPIRSLPAEKDATDGELALREALERGAQEIVLLGVLRGEDRADHALANVLLLALPEAAGRIVRLLDEMLEVRLLREREVMTVLGRRGDIVTLLPLAEPAGGVTTWGLKYDLTGVPLHLGSTRGVSNELIWPQALVQLATGRLLIVHERKK